MFQTLVSSVVIVPATIDAPQRRSKQRMTTRTLLGARQDLRLRLPRDPSTTGLQY
ncbi:hypothetical protein ACFPRL_22035 [Pseudoclavibacter helvolus]